MTQPRNGSFPILFFSLLLFWIGIIEQVNAYQDKSAPKVQLIDLFYQAISSDDGLPESSEFREIALLNYDLEEISPQAIIDRYPEARQYLVRDSMMTIPRAAEFQGFIEDFAIKDAQIEIRNFIFEEGVTFNLNLYADLESEVFNASGLLFEHCEFKDTFMIWFSNFKIDVIKNRISRLFFINETLVAPVINLIDNDIDYLQFWTAAPRQIVVGGNRIGYMEVDLTSAISMQILANTFIGLTNVKDDWRSYIRSREASMLFALGKINKDDITAYERPQKNKLLHINSTERVISDLKIIENQFLDSTGTKPVILAQQSVKLEIIDNNFEVPLILYPSVSIEFIMEGNTYSKVNMSAAMPETPQNLVRVNWKELKDKLYYQRDENSPAYYAQSDEELADTKDFFSLIGGYSRLLEVYKSYGNLQDANDVFLDMKEIHTRRYNYLYRTEGGTTNFFQLNLNRLLSVYTRHGTDPAQAMTASLWIVIFFSIVYFFYPSDWDTRSKSVLLADFRKFRESNEHGYLQPFLKLFKGVIKSFFNAITLSVNSFVTLGFGTIPTRGLAKYICIFQGFLGWFLLSIFIVALINQILI